VAARAGTHPDPEFKGFSRDAIQFLVDLAAHNDRAWFLPRKAEFERLIREPMEQLCIALEEQFRAHDIPLHADPAKSPFRIYRDTRFSKDKSPYKTAAAAVIGQAHGGIGTLYLQVSGDGLMVGGGAYTPDGEHLARLRAAIADDKTGPELEEIVAEIRRGGGEVGAHEELKTAPRGYPADHPRIELLRLKGIIGWYDHPAGPWLQSAAARDQVADGWRSLSPLNAWLATNVAKG